MITLKHGLAQLWALLKAHKIFVVLICLVQLLLLGSAAVVFLHYQLAILEDVKDVVGPLDGATFDAGALQAGQPFVQDFLPIYQSYQQLLRDVKAFTAWIMLFILIGGTILWLATHHLVNKLHWKDALRIALRYILCNTIALSISALLLTFMVQTALANVDNNFTPYFVILGVIGFILYLSVLITTLHARTPSWKEWGRKIVSSLTSSFGFHLRTFLIGWLLLAVLVCLIGLSIYLDSALLLLAFIIFTVGLVMIRLYFVIMTTTIIK